MFDWKRKLLEDYPDKEHYINRYHKMITAWNNPKVPQKLGDNHHILPKAKTAYPEFSSLSQHPWNKARLEHRHHYLVHWLLAKIMGAGQWVAFNRMRKGINKKIIPSSLWGLSRKHFKENQSKTSKNTTAVVHELYNKRCVYVKKHLVQEYLFQGWKTGDGSKGVKKDYEMRWYYKPDTNESFRGNPKNVPDGFIPGRARIGKFKGFNNINDVVRDIPNKNKMGITDGTNNKYIDKDEKIPKNWKKGWTSKPRQKIKCIFCSKLVDSTNIKRHEKACGRDNGIQ